MKKALFIALSLLLIGGGVYIGIRYFRDREKSEDIYEEAQNKYVLSVNHVENSDSDDEINVMDDLLDSIGLSGMKDKEDKKDKKDNDSAITVIDESVPNAEKTSSNDTQAVYTDVLAGTWQEQINVDLKTLTIQYPDVRGWLYFENENISYPIVQAYSDDKYIRMSYTGEKISAGSIFMEAFNAGDFSDAHTIIYGHNMKNHSMFGTLKNYLEQPKYYGNHQYFQIIKLNADGSITKNRYKIFAYCKTNATSKIYTVCREHDSAFADVLNCITSSSANAAGIPVSAENYVVTLSTCSNGDNMLTVSAVLVDTVSE